MLMGNAEVLSEPGSAKDLMLSTPLSGLDGDEEAEDPLEVLYTASFEELSSKYVQYDTIIWLSISLLLVLAWGIGIIMLLYLPFRRYVLRKDVASRKLYVTSKEIVYKVSRPSFIPFCGETKIEKHVPLSMVIDIIIEQGCLQSVYGLHTFRIESIAHGKAAPVDELQVQGVHNPAALRKVVLSQASEGVLDASVSWNPYFQMAGGESMFGTGSFTLGLAVLASPSKDWKRIGSPLHAPTEPRVPTDLMLNKLEEVNKSVKKIEFLIEKNQPATRASLENF
ncbi:hypothetical protein CDL12_05290 [Handroanthus impetiginosus]|uniref:DUF7642 domain-containing protein n=1 Tax=Handroanthus impetiginosus TaxID=429701 RepID=A0A2G9HXD1_9LAMI|nr:hypothetical protein CDL12_05290 [Handroanthus impetiginosus]